MTGPEEQTQALRAALSEAEAPVRFFFRADDVGWEDAALWPMLDLFAVRDLPVDLAAIPGALHPRLIGELVGRCEASSGRLRVHQHGWRHENHEAVGRKCEFGPARSLDQQRRDLCQGRNMLRDAFGVYVDPIFTPPWNRCEQCTADLCAEEGFRALSRDAGAKPLETGDLAEIPVSIDWSRMAEVDVSRIGDVVRDAMAKAMPVGVMLHHAVMTGEDRGWLASLLDLLAAHENAVCIGMRQSLELVERA